jgi:hypothetical protein
VHIFEGVGSNEEPAVLEGQTSIEDLLSEPLVLGHSSASSLQQMLPGLEA